MTDRNRELVPIVGAVNLFIFMSERDIYVIRRKL